MKRSMENRRGLPRKIFLVWAVCSYLCTWVASDLQKGLLLGRIREKSSCSNCLMKVLKEFASSHNTRCNEHKIIL